MQRKQLLLGILGLLFTATAARAQTVTQVTLFGQKYNLERHNPAGKYKNGLSVTADDWRIRCFASCARATNTPRPSGGC